MEPSVFKIDVFAVARAGAVLEGEIALGAMARLAPGLAHLDGVLRYRAAGRTDERGRPGLLLLVQTRLPLRCDRCGGQLDFEMSVERDFYFVRTEAELAAVAIDDAPEEALLGNTHFDLAGLIEDEAILQLPISPRHQDCDLPAGARSAPVDPGRRLPFAALAGLRENFRHSVAAAASASAGTGEHAAATKVRGKFPRGDS